MTFIRLNNEYIENKKMVEIAREILKNASEKKEYENDLEDNEDLAEIDDIELDSIEMIKNSNR